MRVAIVPGSFDPITTGHLDIIKRASELFDKVVIGVAANPGKKTLFSIDERVKVVKEATDNLRRVEVETFDGLLVKFAQDHHAHVIIKGLRAVSDFEHEFQMAQLNRELDASMETIFMMASPENAYLSSSAVKEIAKYGGDVKGLVPLNVERELKKKFSGGKEER